MQSLHIDPHSLPAQAPGEWEGIWQQRQGHPPATAELAAAAQHQASLQDPAWVRDFDRMRLQGPQPGQAWADDFARQVPPAARTPLCEQQDGSECIKLSVDMWGAL